MLTLHSTPIIQGTAHQLSASKSISNRALLLKALANNHSTINNLSTARDTQLMNRWVNSPEKNINVMDAGTTMRFLTAYFALTGQNKILMGTTRMNERPIELLVEALNEIGARTRYIGNKGFPPIETLGFEQQLVTQIKIPGNVSSQYISALMMVGSILPQGLTLSLTGKVISIPYIEMTAALMRQFGVEVDFNRHDNTCTIRHATFKKTHIVVESDWSSASYWFGLTALAKEAAITLLNIAKKSLQGDRVIVEVMEQLGVCADFREGNLYLSKKPTTTNKIYWDFKDCPDLAQTVLPVCAAKGIVGEFVGLESLRIKETDRILALQQELAKIGAVLIEVSKGTWQLQPGNKKLPIVTINTYHDHRMAMGFASWATLFDLKIENPEVVNKSYPGFWEDLKTVGFQME